MRSLRSKKRKHFIARKADRYSALFYIGSETGRQIFFYGVFLTLIFLCITLYNPSFLSSLENKLYDTLIDAVEYEVPPIPLIVDIDEKSLAALGQWPWPRYQIAKLLRLISDAGAASIGVDILFPEPDRTSLNRVRQELFIELGIRLNLDNIPYQLRDNDVYLANTLIQGPFILGYKFFFSGTGNMPKAAIPLDLIFLNTPGSKEKQISLYEAKGTIESLPEFSKSMDGAGFVNVRPDADGVIRRMPLLIEFDGKIYPSLALAAVMKAKDIQKGVLKVSDMGVEALYLDDTKIPLGPKGNLLIRYRGKKGSFDYISAVDLLNGQVDVREKLANRIVFVGTSATGLKDSYTTPFDTLFPGIEVNATVADNILNNMFLSRPAWSRGGEIFITLISGVLVSFVLAFSTPLISLIFPGIGLLFLWIGALLMFKTANIFFSPLYPWITLIGCFAFLSLLRFRMAEKESQKRVGQIHRIESELNVAREIQRGVLPKVFPPFPDQKFVDLFADYIPAREVGGDLYDFFFMDEDHLCFTIGDVSDKGVPASLFMVITRTLIKNLASFCSSPADLMIRINNILCMDNPRALFVTLFIGILNLKTGKVTYANGGHNLPVIFSAKQGIIFKQGISGPVVGAMEELPYTDLSFTLEPGDGIFLYTDGVTEAMDKEQKVFSDGQLLQVCSGLGKESATQIVTAVLSQVELHVGTAPQSDDIAMMMLRFCKLKID